MPLSGFQDLCDSIAELAGTGAPQAVMRGPHAQAATMDLRGVAITAASTSEESRNDRGRVFMAGRGSVVARVPGVDGQGVDALGDEAAQGIINEAVPGHP